MVLNAVWNFLSNLNFQPGVNFDHLEEIFLKRKQDFSLHRNDLKKQLKYNLDIA